MTSPVTVLSDLTWPRRTARCSIRPARPEDAGPTWEFLRRPDVATWTGLPGTTWETYRGRFDDPDRLAARLVVEHDERVVGELSVSPGDGWSQVAVREEAAGTEAELGWSLHPDVHGRGLGTEMVAELVALSLSPAPDGLGLRRVTAGCFAANEPSWRVMERVGMRREAHNVRDSLHAELGWLDGFTYALLAEEWATTPPGG